MQCHAVAVGNAQSGFASHAADARDRDTGLLSGLLHGCAIRGWCGEAEFVIIAAIERKFAAPLCRLKRQRLAKRQGIGIQRGTESGML